MKKIMTCIKDKIIIFGILFAIVLTTFSADSITAKADESVIKIGYDLNSNFIKENNGEFYGYGVEYLEKIAEYTGWQYEYVNDKSWQDSLEKLRTGEIDLICTAHYTEERAQEFLYSDIPLGYETTLLYTNSDNKISYQDYEAMNDCKVGLLLQSYSAEEFVSYAEKHEIACKTVYFEQENDMLAALENGQIDMMAIGSRYGTANMKIVDRLGANAFYCMTNKENEIMIKEIESVLQQIMFDDPEFEGDLNAEYFGHNALSYTPLYTNEELAYIDSLGTVKVKLLLNQRPSCYIENGETQGIWVEYLKLISEKSGIQFELESGVFDEDSEEIYNEYLEQDYLLLRTLRAMEHSNTENLITTIPLMDVEISYIQRQEEFVQARSTEYTIALTQEMSYVEPLLIEVNPGYQIVYYENGESCFDAVIRKEADMAILNTFRASYLLQKPEYADNLTEVPGTDYNNKIHLVASEEQQMLIDILNKAINHISDEEKDEIVTRELLMHPYPLGFDDVWYQYWEWIVGIAFVLVVALVVYTILTRRMANLRVEKKEYELLQKKVQLDELTGLYNRSYFYEMAKEFIANADEEMCIVTMDISNFKVVNELYGMNIGDRLLKDIAQQVLKLEGDHEFLAARFMADHYYMCMPRSEFEKIHLPKRFKTFLEDMDIKVVYGVFFVSDHTDMPVNIMCDRATLAAHDKHHKYVEYVHFYNDDIRKEMLEEQEIENSMEKALDEKQFYIVVQPKYNGVTKEIVGGEVLVRWQHPEKGIVSPGIFIKVFEKNGFIIQLDYFVWEEACRLLAKQNEAGIRIPLSVNVSRAHFYGNELRHKLFELIDTYGIQPEQLELEITESICGEDPEVIYEKIKELREAGFKIAMDDFGSGYSSLNMLKEMPLDIIKMDLKFLDGEEAKSRLILGSLIKLAQAMELKVVVEGVEIDSQVEFLSRFKDCSLQGYYFSRPVVETVYEEMVMK